MLPKSSRISRENFTSLLKTSRFFHSEHFLLRVGDPIDKSAHFGVSVSKKISKKAVIRNKIRRRVYSSIHKIIKRCLPIQALLIAKNGVEIIKGENLDKELDKLFKSAKIIN